MFPTVFPALMLTSAPSRIAFEGRNPQQSGSAIRLSGAGIFCGSFEDGRKSARLRFERYGFYPAGGELQH